MHYNVNKAIISKVLQNLRNRNCYKPEYAFYTIITRQVYKKYAKKHKNVFIHNVSCTIYDRKSDKSVTLYLQPLVHSSLKITNCSVPAKLQISCQLCIMTKLNHSTVVSHNYTLLLCPLCDRETLQCTVQLL